jgi:hypothetical protein
MATREAEVQQDDDVIEAILIPDSVAITATDRAQIDVQIATARQYPRSIKKARDEALLLATMNEETAASMFYSLPRKDKTGNRIFIEGPSVRFAEVLLYSWGNLRAEARVTGIDDTHITAQGTCLDLERNTGARVEVKRRITGSSGQRYNEDMIVMTGNAASAIAFRNAIYKVIPKALVDSIYEAAKKTARGEGQPIETRRQKLLTWFARVGKFEADVLEFMGVESVNDIGEEQLEQLLGLKTAIQEGTTTVEDAFSNENGRSAKTEGLNEKLRKNAKPSRGQHQMYMAAMTTALEEAGYDKANWEDARHLWQEQQVGKRSTSDWSKEDYSKALHLLETGTKP